MSQCTRCGFSELLASYNYCPSCGAKQKKMRSPVVVNTDGPLTEEDWEKILGLGWSRERKKKLEALKEGGNVPIGDWTSRPEEPINSMFIRKDLPYRYRSVVRHHKGDGAEFEYKYKIFKVRPKNT